MSREEIKRKIFGWLYGPSNVSLGIPQVQKYYDKQKALQKYWNGEEIKNPYGRIVKADEFHALNALIQSTTSDTFLRRAIAVNKLLEGKKSFTTALIHDSMVIDFDRNDKDILENLIKEFGNTDLGIFKVNASLGTSFGNMKKFR
jgi:DNA polymerase I-like protein with 3'-5' exonuclease and polymerase domains